MIICLERGADLHTAQLMPLPLTVSCSSKIQIGFIFLVPAQGETTKHYPDSSVWTNDSSYGRRNGEVLPRLVSSSQTSPQGGHAACNGRL